MGRTLNVSACRGAARFAAGTTLVLVMGAACFEQNYTQTDLVSNANGAARVTDPQLINPEVATAQGTAVPSKHEASAVKIGDGSPSAIRAHISSAPAGADIQVDGAYVGVTPSDIDLTCCWHDVTIIKRGRKPWTRRLRTTGGHLNINAQLQK
jgi:CRISPR/Cas system-associated exonuclease Cas4 (RecB family)